MSHDFDEVVDRHSHTAPVHLEAIAATLEIAVDYATETDAISGTITRTATTASGFAMTINGRQQERRQRFTLAVLLAHFALHRDLIRARLTCDARHDSDLGARHTAHARRRAVQLMIPRKLTLQLMTTCANHLDEVAQRLGVPSRALALYLPAISRQDIRDDRR